MNMAQLFLTITGVGAGLVGLCYIAVHIIRRSAEFLTEEEEERENNKIFRLPKREEEEELFL